MFSGSTSLYDIFPEEEREIMETKKGYVIQEVGYDYNDEVYYSSEGGIPKVIIMDEVLAKKKLMELEINAWKGRRIGYYGYGLDEIASNESDFEKALKDTGIEGDDWYHNAIPEDATDEQVKNLIRASSIRFFEMVEVDIEGASVTFNNEDYQPSKEILDNQEAMARVKSWDEISKETREKKNITGSNVLSVDEDFLSGDVMPEPTPEEVTAEDIKEAVKETEDNFLEIKNEMRRLRDEARSKVKNFFIKGMNAIFDKYPEVKTVSWTQYTPYFNDGEACTFWCNSGDYWVNGYGDDWGIDDSEEGWIDVLDYDWRDTKQYTHPKGEEIRDAISGFLKQLDDDDYLTMFGDHAKVVVKKDEVIVEEYRHD